MGNGSTGKDAYTRPELYRGPGIDMSQLEGSNRIVLHEHGTSSRLDWSKVTPEDLVTVLSLLHPDVWVKKGTKQHELLEHLLEDEGTLK